MISLPTRPPFSTARLLGVDSILLDRFPIKTNGSLRAGNLFSDVSALTSPLTALVIATNLNLQILRPRGRPARTDDRPTIRNNQGGHGRRQCRGKWRRRRVNIKGLHHPLRPAGDWTPSLTGRLLEIPACIGKSQRHRHAQAVAAAALVRPPARACAHAVDGTVSTASP